MFSGSNQTASSGSACTAGDPPEDSIGECVGRAGLPLVGEPPRDAQRGPMDIGVVERFLVGEVAIERGPGAAGGAGDVDHRRLADADLGKGLTGGVEQLVDGGVLVRVARPAAVRHALVRHFAYCASQHD